MKKLLFILVSIFLFSCGTTHELKKQARFEIKFYEKLNNKVEVYLEEGRNFNNIIDQDEIDLDQLEQSYNTYMKMNLEMRSYIEKNLPSFKNKDKIEEVKLIYSILCFDAKITENVYSTYYLLLNDSDEN